MGTTGMDSLLHGFVVTYNAHQQLRANSKVTQHYESGTFLSSRAYQAIHF